MKYDPKIKSKSKDRIERTIEIKIVLGSTLVVEQLLFSIVPSIQNFDFGLILGSFFYFLEPYWGIFGVNFQIVLGLIM